MPRPTEGTVALAVLSLALMAVACNKGPAEDALEAADRELAAAKAEIETYAPEQLAPLESAVQAARAELEQGHYTAALKAAQALPGQIQGALAAATVQKSRMAATWKDLAGGVPGLVQALTGKLAGLVEAKALPRGLTAEGLASAQADLASMARAWTEATAAFQGGDVSRAVRTGQDVKARAEAVAATLGMTPPDAARENR